MYVCIFIPIKVEVNSYGNACQSIFYGYNTLYVTVIIIITFLQSINHIIICEISTRSANIFNISYITLIDLISKF